MPGRIFTPQERKRLDAFPSEIAEADLIRYFTLSHSDLDLVRRQRGDQNRIGFALQLCALRYMGFCPDDLEIVPTTALAFVADQLQASPAALHVYGKAANLGWSALVKFQRTRGVLRLRLMAVVIHSLATFGKTLLFLSEIDSFSARQCKT